MVLTAVLTATLTGWASASAAEVDDSEALGEALAQTCTGCHAVGNQVLPALQVFTQAELLERLRDYKADRRQGTLMNRLSKGYTDAELILIARALGQ